MDLMPLGNDVPPTQEVPVISERVPDVALADTPAFVAERAAEVRRQQEEKRKDRITMFASVSLAAVALLVGLIVLARFTTEAHEKNLEFQAELNRAHYARRASEHLVTASNQARSEASARQAAENQNRKIADSQARAYNAALMRQRQLATQPHYLAPALPAPPNYQAPPPAPRLDNPPLLDTPVERTEDPMQSAKEELQQHVQSEYGGYRNIKYRETASGLAAVVTFSDGEIASYANRGQGWMEMTFKENPGLMAVHG